MPEQLDATIPKLDADRVDFDPEPLLRDPDALVTLLAAIVTRSGYAWQPSLLPYLRKAKAP